MPVPAADDLITAALDQLQIGPTELASALCARGVPSTYQRINGLRTGKLKFRYDELWELLDLLGWIDPTAPTPPNRLEEVAEAVEAMATGQKEILRLLRRVERQQTTGA